MYFVSRGPARARTMAYFGEGKGPIHVDNVKCTGSERSLADCIKQDIGTHNCRHSEDAGVICDHLGKKVPGNSNKGEVLFWAVDEHVQVGNCHSRKRWNPTITPYRGDSYMKWINRNKMVGNYMPSLFHLTAVLALQNNHEGYQVIQSTCLPQFTVAMFVQGIWKCERIYSYSQLFKV